VRAWKNRTVSARPPAYGTRASRYSDRMSTSPSPGDLPVRRIDRILAFMSLGLLVLSIVCFFAIIIGTSTGMRQADFGTGAWPVVSLIVYIAPPIAFALLIALLIATFVRRARANKGR